MADAASASAVPQPPPSRLPLSPPETTTHHYAAQKTDSSPAISVWNNVAIAHAKERYGYQPETVQDVDVLVVVVPELCNRSLTTWIGEGDSSEAREWLHSLDTESIFSSLHLVASVAAMIWYAKRLCSKGRIMVICHLVKTKCCTGPPSI